MDGTFGSSPSSSTDVTYLNDDRSFYIKLNVGGTCRHYMNNFSTFSVPVQNILLSVGTLHITTMNTLMAKDTMLKTMFSTNVGVRKDSEGLFTLLYFFVMRGFFPKFFVGFIRIDRSGKHFGGILNWLRDGDIPLPACTTEIEELYHEAKYYLCEVFNAKFYFPLA